MTNQLHALRAGASRYADDDGHTQAEVAHQNRQVGSSAECPEPPLSAQTPDASPKYTRKSFGTTQARLALRGYSPIETGMGFQVSRWNHPASLLDLDAACGFLLRVGGKP